MWSDPGAAFMINAYHELRQQVASVGRELIQMTEDVSAIDHNTDVAIGAIGTSVDHLQARVNTIAGDVVNIQNWNNTTNNTIQAYHADLIEQRKRISDIEQLDMEQCCALMTKYFARLTEYIDEKQKLVDLELSQMKQSHNSVIKMLMGVHDTIQAMRKSLNVLNHTGDEGGKRKRQGGGGADAEADVGKPAKRKKEAQDGGNNGKWVWVEGSAAYVLGSRVSTDEWGDDGW